MERNASKHEGEEMCYTLVQPTKPIIRIIWPKSYIVSNSSNIYNGKKRWMVFLWRKTKRKLLLREWRERETKVFSLELREKNAKVAIRKVKNCSYVWRKRAIAIEEELKEGDGFLFQFGV